MLFDLLYVVAAVAILWKCADLFVEGAVGIAEKLHVPQMFVGLVVVSLATTSPELMSSILAALKNKPELALANAVGSVGVDAGVALGLAALVASKPLWADRNIFRSSALVLLAAYIGAFLLVLNGTLGRLEGLALLGVYIVYTVVTYRRLRANRAEAKAQVPDIAEIIGEDPAHLPTWKILLYFGVGFVGVLGGSYLLLEGALGLAVAFKVPEVVVGLLIVAVGTSTPEIATCVASAMKGRGGLAIGNIIGADILNICWVAGMSAMVHPLAIRPIEVYTMFPAVFLIVLSMLFMLYRKLHLTRANGAVLVGLYAVYVGLLMYFLPPGSIPMGH